ncbi:MAG: Small-conductance mechanosensitive channel MscMJ [Methanomassiliicoccales archaeon PtaB.Bin134]|nr:MAG: Small-conductance mechanosensitive channel MscMJ [Methanomassiliicoccales archaeon PtaB.Bin134]
MDLNDTIPYTNIELIQLIVALIILVVGFVAIKIIGKMLRRVMCKTHMPALLVDFLLRVLKVVLYVVLLLVFLGALGFEVNSALLALSAVIGLVLGFGLQDTMMNFFSGIWLALVRPIEKDEWITVNGFSGRVNAIGIMSTEMITADNVYITLPNKTVWGSPITNNSRMPTRRVDVSVGTSYSGDVNKAIGVAMELMSGHPKVHKDPAPVVIVTDLGSSSVNLSMRAWTDNADYWEVKGDLTKGVFEAFAREGIEIPFPQMDVHLARTG